MSFLLTNKTIVITGAAGGIGSELSRVCAELGANLVLIDLEEPLSLANELRAARNISVITAALDVRDRAGVESLLKQIPEIDAIVANAGFCPWDDWNDSNWDEVFRTTIDINALGVINFARPGLQRLIEQGFGRMIVVSSVAARMGGLKASPHYVVAKAGLNGLVKWLARHAAPHGVLVNGVAPGATITGMTRGQVFDTETIPIKRFATPREIALPIAFLCSEASSYICGTILDVNGGVYMN